MSDRTLSVDATLMLQIAQLTGDHATEIRADLEGLSRQVADLLAGSWTGAAANAFAQAWAEFDGAAQDIAATLQQNAGRLGESSGSYANSEAATLASIRSVTPALDVTFSGLDRFA